MASFRTGSEIASPLSLTAPFPIDARDVANTVEQVLAEYPPTCRYLGMKVWIEDENKFYVFSKHTLDSGVVTSGLEDSDFRPFESDSSSYTDEKVKLDATATDAKYLNELIDNATIEVDATNNCLIVKKIDGQTVTVAEINLLSGITSNIQEQINNLSKSMTMYGVFDTKADLLASTDPIPIDGNTAIVIEDEDNDNKQMTYIFIGSTSSWTKVAESSIEIRDFTTNPIDLDTETTGILSEDKIDIAIARLDDVLDKLTYKGSEDGIVKQADTLTGLTSTIEALNKISYTDEEGAAKAIGGFNIGDKADNMSFQDFAYKLLHPYIAPVVSLSISPSALQDKSGDGVTSVTLAVNISKKSKDIISVRFYCDSTLLESKTDGVSNGGTFTYTYTPDTAIKSNTTFKVAVSDGNITNVSKILSFVYPSYIGYVSSDITVDASNAQSLITSGTLKQTVLQTGSGYTYTYTATNSRVVYLYDTSKTKITKILDSNGFGYISDFTSSTIELNGTNYYCLQQNIAATVSGFKFVFS